MHLVADDLAQGGRLFRRTDQAVDAEHLRLLGARLDQIGDAEAIARRVQIAIVIGGQHGDGEDLQIRSRARLDRRLHGLRIGMHGEEGRAKRGDALDAARHGIADVVQLEIDEHLLARVGELADQRQAAGISELIADLVERHAVAEPGDHRFRGMPRRADRAPRSGGRGERSWLAACHLTSCAGKLRSTAAPAPSAPRYRPDASTGPYRHRPRPRTTARAGSESPCAWQADRISRSAASARVPPSRLSEAAAIAKARSRNTWPRVSCGSCTRVTQSMAFLSSARHRGIIFRRHDQHAMMAPTSCA